MGGALEEHTADFEAVALEAGRASDGGQVDEARYKAGSGHRWHRQRLTPRSPLISPWGRALMRRPASTARR